MSASPVNNSSNGAAAPTSVNEARDPSGFLSEIIGAPVTVKLNSGVVYRGVFLPKPHCGSLRRKKEMKRQMDDRRTLKRQKITTERFADKKGKYR
jgi:hypothetical protein